MNKKVKQNFKGIAIKNYRLEPEPNAIGRFALYLLSENKKGEVVTNKGFGMTFSRCIDIIAEEQVWDEKKSISVKEYLFEKEKNYHDLLKVVDKIFEDMSKTALAELRDTI